MKNQKQINISDTIHGTIRLNSLEKEVISTQIFNRLHSIAQNSTVYLTFPTNRTKRFEHSVGTMWLCGKMFQESISNTSAEDLKDFFDRIQKIIDYQIKENLDSYSARYRTKIGDDNLNPEKLIEYKNLKVDQQYYNFIPNNVMPEYTSTYVIIFQAIRLGALLHDVGHPPFSHISEFALKKIWINIGNIDENIRTERQKDFIKILNKYFETEQDLHEQIGNKIVTKVLDDIIDVFPKNSNSADEEFNLQLFKILISEITSAILQEKNEAFGELHRLIDGTLDGDRMDYVCRDPINSGLNVGVIEYDRIINGMSCIKHGDAFVFAPSSKAIDSIDDFFNRRWKMYKQIIYHHRVIKTDFLLQECIEKLAFEYLKKPEADEKCKNILPYDISGLWKAIEDKASHKGFFDMLIQWDDGWLMTVLKVHYFTEYAQNSEEILRYMLEELLSNKKNYFPLIKRMEDFVLIDRTASGIFFTRYQEISDLISQIESRNISINSNGKEMKVPFLFPRFYNELVDEFKRYSGDYKKISKRGFVLSRIKKIFSNLLDEQWFDEILDKEVDEIIESRTEILDAFALTKKVKTGIPGGKTCTDGGLGVFSGNDRKIIDFVDISNENDILQADIDFMPVFYVYILKKDKDIEYDTIKEILGQKIANSIIDMAINKLNKLKIN